MKHLFYHIIYLTLGILLVLLAVAPAAAQIVVEQCDTMEFSVTSRPTIDESHFVWAVYNSSDDPVDVIDPAGALDPALTFVDGQYSGRTVQVVGLEPGKYYVRIHVWDEISCTDNVEMYLMEVLEHLPEAELTGDSVCYGEPAFIKIILTGLGPWDIEYTYGDGTEILNLNGITETEYTLPMPPLPVGTTEIWVTQIIDQCTENLIPSDKARIVIYPKPTNSKIYPVIK